MATHPPRPTGGGITPEGPCAELVLRCRLLRIAPESEAQERGRFQAYLHTRLLTRSSRRSLLDRTGMDDPPESSVARELQNLERKLDSLAQKLDALLEPGEELCEQWILLSERGIVVRCEAATLAGIAPGDLVHASFYLPLDWGTRIEALGRVRQILPMQQPGWSEIALPFEVISESAQDEIARAVFQLQLQLQRQKRRTSDQPPHP